MSWFKSLRGCFVIFLWILALNRHQYWYAALISLAFVGSQMNKLVIGLNRGKMPVRTAYPSVAESLRDSTRHKLANEQTKLAALGDIIEIKMGHYYMQMSIGDMLVYVGLTSACWYGLVLLVAALE